MTPILMLGAGRLGGALIEGWRGAGVFKPSDLMIREPNPTAAIEGCAEAGARLNPPDSVLAEARTVLLAVKPQTWREAAAAIAPHLAPDAIIVSVAAGVGAADISSAFGGRSVARVMPITAVSIGQGAASIYAADEAARARAHVLFDPVGVTIDLADEELLHAATAISGSAPAYLYAFIEALEAAGVATGLSIDDASRLARATMTGAAALLAQSGQSPAELRRQVTSPGGTTQAALDILMGEKGLGPLLRDAAVAAARRSKELGG